MQHTVQNQILPVLLTTTILRVLTQHKNYTVTTNILQDCTTAVQIARIAFTCNIKQA